MFSYTLKFMLKEGPTVEKVHSLIEESGCH